jgi:hypothetical protein
VTENHEKSILRCDYGALSALGLSLSWSVPFLHSHRNIRIGTGHAGTGTPFWWPSREMVLGRKTTHLLASLLPSKDQALDNPLLSLLPSSNSLVAIPSCLLKAARRPSSLNWSFSLSAARRPTELRYCEHRLASSLQLPFFLDIPPPTFNSTSLSSTTNLLFVIFCILVLVLAILSSRELLTAISHTTSTFY